MDGACVPAGPEIDAGWCEASEPVPTCMSADLVVSTTEDERDGGVDNADVEVARGGTGLSLREALILASNLPPPHRITFANEVLGSSVDVGTYGGLPDVPSLTYLDGGVGRTLVPTASEPAYAGLSVHGTGVVVSDLEISGFGGVGVLVDEGSRDVHLFRLRVGAPGAPNLEGITIRPSCRRVVIGRGRELDCVDPVLLPPATFIDGYDVNLIVANTRTGILAEETTDLRVYGTWVGFSNRLDDGPEMGNGGTGIHLRDVRDAVVGAQMLSEDLVASGTDSTEPAYVAVGHNEHGIRVDGGTRIRLSGITVGDTPSRYPVGTNAVDAIVIAGNTGPVELGPPLDAQGFEALHYGIVVSDTGQPLQVIGSEALVTVRGFQFFVPPPAEPRYGIKLYEPGATVSIFHVTVVGNFTSAAIHGEGFGADAGLKIVNCLMAAHEPRDVVAVDVSSFDATVARFEGNMRWNVAWWCADCSEIDASNITSDVEPLMSCPSDAVRPLAPDCPTVDRGVETTLDVNGSLPGLYVGCSPDIGAFECLSPECLAVACDI